MTLRAINFAAGLFLTGACIAGPVMAADPITEAEAAAIGVDAYVYLYPLVTMDVTRAQATNIEAGKKMGRGPANAFTNVPEFPTAEFRDVVRPNFDTLYSVAWLDMGPFTCGRWELRSRRAAVGGAELQIPPGG